MKALSILFTLAAASAVHSAEDAVTANGSIRATRKAKRGDVSVEFPVEKKRETHNAVRLPLSRRACALSPARSKQRQT